MASDDELDARVTALEQEVRVAREDAAAARILARGADRDVSSMQDTLREHTKTLARHTATLDNHTATLDNHTATLDNHTATLESHSAKLDMHKALLESLRETQVEQGDEMRRGFGMLAVGQAELLTLLNRLAGPESRG